MNEHVADQRCQRALDREPDIIGIVEGIRQKESSVFQRERSRDDRAPRVAGHRQSDLVQRSFDV